MNEEEAKLRKRSARQLAWILGVLGLAVLLIYVRGLVRERSSYTTSVSVARMEGDLRVSSGLRPIPWDQGETDLCKAVRFNDSVLLNCGSDTYMTWERLQGDMKTAGDKATEAARLQREIYLRARTYAVTFKGSRAAAGKIAGGTNVENEVLWICTKTPDGFSCE